MKAAIKKAIGFFKDWDKQSRYIKWIMERTKPFLGSLLFLLLLNILLTAAGIGSTVASKYIIDGATGTGPGFTVQGIIILSVLTLVNVVISATSGILTSHINERYTFSIRTKAYDSILYGLWHKITAFHSGDIITRLTSDIERVANGVATIIPSFLFLTIRLIAAFFVLFYYDHFLAVAAILIGPVGVLLSLSFGRKLKKYQTELNEIESGYRSFMQETIESIEVTKAFEQEANCHSKLLIFRDKRLNLIMKRNKLNAAMNLCINLVFSIGYLVAFTWGIYKLSMNSITYGTMTIFLSLVAQVQGPIVSLGSLIPQFITVLSSTGRVVEIDSINPENRHQKERDRTSNVGLTIRDLTFGYGKDKVLKNINLEIKSNDIVGVVGSSGSGKTTLVRLILSLVQPQEGTLEFCSDGHIEPASALARRFISYVPQGNTLLSGTIAENLCTGKDDATEDEMWRALEIADAAGFIKKLEAGLHTRIGENATGLSEGQAQRIAIARAIIKNAPILILDEATSALDAKTEEKVIKRMCESGLLRTCIIITHRRSMLHYCTRAIEIDDQKDIRKLRIAP